MPQISPSEKRLMLILGSVVFLVVNGFGFVLISKSMDGIDRDKKRLTERLRVLEDSRVNAAEAEEKGAWIEANLRPYENEDVRETYLDNIINGDLSAGLDLTITKNSPMPTITGAYFVKSRYRANVAGPWLDVKEFLWRIQKPEEFRLIPKLTMVPRKNEADDSEQLVEVQLELEKWWPKPDDFSDPETVPGENVEQPAVPGVESPAGDTPAGDKPADPPAAPADSNPAPPADATPPTPEPAPSTDTPQPNP
jgi:hypothetical protein